MVRVADQQTAEYTLPELGQVPFDFFDAAGKLTSGELAAFLNKQSNATKLTHKPTVTPAEAQAAPGQGTTPIIFGTVVGLEYDQTTDKAYRIFKIPDAFVGDASFHIHWTKSADGDEQGNSVRWRFTYTVFNGSSQDVALVTPTILTVDDAYDDGSVDGTRVVYRTSFVDAPGFLARNYVGLCVDYDSGNSNLATSNPVLVSADLVMREYINK